MAAAGPGGNLIPNPSFETNTNWIRAPLADYTSSQAHSGSRSLQLVHNGNGQSGVYQASNLRNGGVYAGQEYVVSYWVKGVGVRGKSGPGDAPLLVARWRNGSGQPIAEEMYDWAPLGSYSWVQRRIHAQAPTGAAEVDYSIRSWWNVLAGTSFWDDVAVTPRQIQGRGALLNTYQAESANTRTGGKVANRDQGYTGSGYFDVTNNGAVLQWNTVQGGGARVIAMRYAWEGAAKPVDLIVNGRSQGKKVPVTTGRRGSWATENWSVNLPSGANTVRLVVGKASISGDKIQPEVDRLEVYAAQ